MIDKIYCSSRIGNDIHPQLIAMFKELQRGWQPPAHISEEEYNRVRENKEVYPDYYVGYVGFNSTFGAKYFGGYARGFKADGGVTFNKPIWECSCGEGHLSERLKSFGYEVRSTDLIDRGYGESGIDFLTYNQPWNGDILTNPPYKYAKEFIEHAMELIPNGCRVFMFLKVQFLEGKARKELFKKYPPKCVYVSSSRILCAKNALFDEMRAGGGSAVAVAYAWFCFEKGYKGETIIKWIN